MPARRASASAPLGTNSCASDLGVAVDGGARSRCLPSEGQFHKSTLGHQLFHPPFRSRARPTAAFRYSNFRSATVSLLPEDKYRALCRADLPPTRYSLVGLDHLVGKLLRLPPPTGAHPAV